MVTKNQIKLVKSLQQKKYRNQHGLFVAEGEKLVNEILQSDFKAFKIFSSDKETALIYDDINSVTSKELRQMSGQHHSSGILGVFYIPKAQTQVQGDWILALDAVRDPGNLGTIIRLADWFGIQTIICSEDTVDCYNPKVLQATMGSVARVSVQYTVLTSYLETCDLPIYGTFMEGAILGKEELPDKGVLILGNEANGISQEVSNKIDKRLTIPQYATKTAESLNVASATAIILHEIRNG